MKTLSGEFEVVDGKLSFTCHTKHTNFSEVEESLILLRNEIDRQLKSKANCPFYNQSVNRLNQSNTMAINPNQNVWSGDKLENEKHVGRGGAFMPITDQMLNSGRERMTGPGSCIPVDGCEQPKRTPYEQINREIDGLVKRVSEAEHQLIEAKDHLKNAYEFKANLRLKLMYTYICGRIDVEKFTLSSYSDNARPKITVEFHQAHLPSLYTPLGTFYVQAEICRDTFEYGVLQNEFERLNEELKSQGIETMNFDY